MKTREEILEKIIEDSFYVIINLSDTFYYACADSEQIAGEDYIQLVPLIEKYGYYAEVAYCSIKRGHDPQVARVLTKEYYLAKEEILKMIYNGNKYEPFYGLTQNIEIEKKEDWLALVKEFFKIKITIKYQSISDLLNSVNCGINSIIGNDALGHHIKINAFSKTLAIVESIKYKGEEHKGCEYVIELYELTRLIEQLNYTKKDQNKDERNKLSKKEKELFEELTQNEED